MSNIPLKHGQKTQLPPPFNPLKSEKDQCLFGYGSSILEFIQLIKTINKIYKKLGCTTRIKPKVFYKAIKLVINNKPFTTKTLKAYLKEVKKVEVFKQRVCTLFNVEFITFNYNAESLLLGLPLKQIKHPTESIDNLGGDRFIILYNFYSGKVGLTKTVNKLKGYKKQGVILHCITYLLTLMIHKKLESLQVMYVVKMILKYHELTTKDMDL